jgi:hypothetical protein
MQGTGWIAHTHTHTHTHTVYCLHTFHKGVNHRKPGSVCSCKRDVWPLRPETFAVWNLQKKYAISWFWLVVVSMHQDITWAKSAELSRSQGLEGQQGPRRSPATGQLLLWLKEIWTVESWTLPDSGQIATVTLIRWMLLQDYNFLLPTFRPDVFRNFVGFRKRMWCLHPTFCNQTR